jgi:hypothetical protein
MTKAEQEVHIWKDGGETEYCVYYTDTAELPPYLRLAEKVGGRVSSTKAARKSFCLKTQSCSR